ncbi:MAG: WbqC family protein [Pseudoflavonifractor sp.]|nr:WbqC family protein [Alloprevotella sp.]MCM1116304.1 WbqC family protein [Pseudoflavonifractor sp.]
MNPHPLVTRPAGDVVTLPPRLLPPAAYYALSATFPTTVIDWGCRFDRRCKATHRFAIADTRGELTLTVPILHSRLGSPWASVALSDHGRWQETIPTALESAYGRTPFFEFYADRLLPLFRHAAEGEPLVDFAEALDREVRAILGFTQTVIYSREPQPIAPAYAGPWPTIAPYWQVRQSALGFIPSLSILDLIFNHGPEAPLHLRLAQLSPRPI